MFSELLVFISPFSSRSMTIRYQYSEIWVWMLLPELIASVIFW